MVEEGSRIKVLIVDHSAFGRAALPRLIEADPQLELVGVAREAEEALRHVLELDPDVVLMSLGLPGDSVTLVRKLMLDVPRPVVMMVPPKVEPIELVRAIEAGAVAGLYFELENNSAQLMAFQSLLVSKLKAFGAARLRPSEQSAAPAKKSTKKAGRDDVEVLQESVPDDSVSRSGRPRSPLALNTSSGLIQPRRILAEGASDPDRRAEVVVFGGGAGSPSALRKIVTQLPNNLNIALLALVRMPEELLPLYAERLARDSAIRVMVAQEGEPVRPGILLLAPNGRNMGMVRTGRVPKALVRLIEPEPGASTVPSLDVTLRACSSIYGAGVLGMVLSGLSRDGVAGFQAVKAKGGMTAALDLRSAAVPSSSQMCQDAGVVDEVIDPAGAVALITRLGLRI